MPDIKRKQRPPAQPMSDMPEFAFVAVGEQRDEADDARVAGFHLVRGPDGVLYGVQDKPDE